MPPEIFSKKSTLKLHIFVTKKKCKSKKSLEKPAAKLVAVK